MLYEYNGIVLDALTERADRVAVYADDNVQFVGTQWTISIEAVWNPDIISYFQGPAEPAGDSGGDFGDATGLPIPPANFGPGPGFVPGPGGVNIFAIQNGASPIQTDNVLRKMLLEPRKRLRIYDRSGVSQNEFHYWVDTAKNGTKDGNLCDPKWGPKPIALNVRQIVGVRSFLVTWQCEFFEAKKPYKDDDPDSLLLSNSHSMTHTLDHDYTVLREVTGTALWRADALAKLNVNPDAWRPNLLLPIPLGWKRDQVSVRMRDDMQSVDYSFVDRQLHTSVQDLVGVGVTRVEGGLTEALIRDRDTLTGAIGTYRSFLDWKQLHYFANHDKVDAGNKAGQDQQMKDMIQLIVQGVKTAMSQPSP